MFWCTRAFLSTDFIRTLYYLVVFARLHFEIQSMPTGFNSVIIAMFFVSFVPCHFPFVCPLSFLILRQSSTLSAYSLFVLCTNTRRHTGTCTLTHSMECQRENQKPPIIYLGKNCLFFFELLSFAFSLTKMYLFFSVVCFQFQPHSTHSILIHFILYAFITFLVTFFHLFSISFRSSQLSSILCHISLRIDSFFLSLTVLFFFVFLVNLLCCISGIYHILSISFWKFVIRHLFSSFASGDYFFSFFFDAISR